MDLMQLLLLLKWVWGVHLVNFYAFSRHAVPNGLSVYLEMVRICCYWGVLSVVDSTCS